jgi:hypothetical protein
MFDSVSNGYDKENKRARHFLYDSAISVASLRGNFGRGDKEVLDHLREGELQLPWSRYKLCSRVDPSHLIRIDY